MGRFNDTLGTINTSVRTLLMLVLVGGAGFFGYKAYEIYNQPRQQLAAQLARLESTERSLEQANQDLLTTRQQVQLLEEEVAEKAAEVERLDLSLRLLTVRHRLARLTVLEQRELPEDEVQSGEQDAPPSDDTQRPEVMTRIEFVEINEEGSPIGESKQFEILGNMVYVDYLQVTFSDQYVKEADLDRSTAIALFHRIFGEFQEPSEGFRLETVGTRPTAYARGTQMSAFERQIWDDFWLISNDPRRAKELGIHAAHGEAVSIRMQPNMTYEIKLRAAGGISVVPISTPPSADKDGN